MSTDLTLGERALAIALSEIGVKEIPPASNTGPRVREYLAGCERADGTKLNLKASNWCMSFASWCCYQALRPGEHAPHGYRAGVVEAVADVRDHETAWTGRWKPVSLVRSGGYTPVPGDLAIYDRSDPAKPETNWYRHVNRVVQWNGDTYGTVGGNENDMVHAGQCRLDNPKLLGFIAYPADAPEPRDMLSSDERQHLLDLVALTLDGITRESVVDDLPPTDADA